MSEPIDNRLIDRRTVLVGAIFLVGGAAALKLYSSRESAPAGSAVAALSTEQYAILEQVAEIIIPTTDTPGAITAGVPVFIRDMLVTWATPQIRDGLVQVLASIDKRAWGLSGRSFLESTPERRVEVLQAFADQAMKNNDEHYRRLRFLVLFGYYHSEIGATKELRLELVPGAWRSCVPMSEVGRASAV